MIEIANNNIEGLSPIGKITYNTFGWLKTFIWMLKSDTKEVEVMHKGIFDKQDKGLVKVKKIAMSAKIEESYFDRLKASLEAGKEVEIKGWKFKVVYL